MTRSERLVIESVATIERTEPARIERKRSLRRRVLVALRLT